VNSRAAALGQHLTIVCNEIIGFHTELLRCKSDKRLASRRCGLPDLHAAALNTT